MSMASLLGLMSMASLLGLTAPQGGATTCASNLDCTAAAAAAGKIGICVTDSPKGPSCLFLTPTPRAEVRALQKFARANPVARQPRGCLENWQGGDPCATGMGDSVRSAEVVRFVNHPEDGQWRWPGVACCVNSRDFGAIYGHGAVNRISVGCPYGAGVTELDLSSCSLSWDDSLAELKLLEKLQLDNNHITHASGALGYLPNLKLLSLNDNQISSISPALGGARALEKVFLSNNRIRDLPGSFGNLSQLQHLNLAHNQLSSLPSSVGKLSTLKSLFLDHNRLQSSALPPRVFGLLSNLEALDLSFNDLTALPADFGRFPKLQSLYLNDNRLKSLQAGAFAQLRSVEELYLQNNALIGLPSLRGIVAATFLSAFNNTLSALPSFVPPNLTHLYLGGNPINASAAQLQNFFGGTARGVAWVDLSVSPQQTYFNHEQACSRKFIEPPALRGKDLCVIRIDINSGVPAGVKRRRRVVDKGDKQLGLTCQVDEPCAFTIHLQDEQGFPVSFHTRLHVCMRHRVKPNDAAQLILDASCVAGLVYRSGTVGRC
eukprot:COSAG01_NODE_3820_length_5664_cov_3.383827_1_plen_547_part_00